MSRLKDETAQGAADSLVESATLSGRAVTLSAPSEGVTLMELRTIVAATESYPDDAPVRVFGVTLCKDDDGSGECWISGVKVTDAAVQESRGDLTAMFWPWATEEWSP